MPENKDGQEKTEQATAKRLHEARMRGQVAKSTDVTTAAVILLGGLTVFLFGPPLIEQYMNFMKTIFSNLSTLQVTDQNAAIYYSELLVLLGKLMLPIMLTIFVLVFAAEVVQVGLKVATKKFTEGLRFKQIFNPFGQIKKLFFSGRAYFELLKSILKLLILGAIVWQTLAGHADLTVGLLERPFFEVGRLIAQISLELIIKTGVVFIIIAAIDFYYQRYRFREDMKMTKQEIKEETKQTQGDPRVKAYLRGLMRNRIRKLMMEKVKSAEVVITNPTHFAVAISYTPGESSAPVVVAKGADFIAKQIREIATDNNIPIVEEPPLARALFFSVDIDDEIPEEMFKAVAQVLAYVYHLKNKHLH